MLWEEGLGSRQGHGAPGSQANALPSRSPDFIEWTLGGVGSRAKRQKRSPSGTGHKIQDIPLRME